MTDEKTKAKYKKMVEKASPNSPILINCIKAFLVGGTICLIGEAINNFFQLFNFSKEDCGLYTSCILIFISSMLTGTGLYSKLGKFAGAGSIVPITGFSNSVTSPAIEFKKEGFILGVGAKIFLIAGPVILYGVLTSILVGIIYYFFGG